MNTLSSPIEPDREASFWLSIIQPWKFISTLMRNKSLYLQFTARAIHAEHKGNILGKAWMVISPLLMMGVYTVVFGVIFGAKFAEVEGVEQNRWTYGLGIFLGLSIFQLFAEGLSTAHGSIISQPNLCKKVVFPLELLPASLLGVSLFRFLMSLMVVLFAISISGTHIGLNALWLFIIFIPLVLLTLGVILAFSALGVFIRDIASFTQFLALAIMYGSAIFYSASDVREKAETVWSFLRFNPLLHIIENARGVVLFNQPIQWEGIQFAIICGVAFFAFGYALFAKLKHAFADVL